MAEQNEDDADPAELTNLARLLVDSWNRGDARAFACLFTTAAEYVTGAGERIRGRQAISALLDKAAPAAQVSVVGQPAVRCDARSAEVRFMWSGADAGGGPRRGSITCACIPRGSGWLIEALHNEEAGMQGDIIQRFHAALPSVRQWIDHFLDDHAAQARAVSTLGFVRLSTCFPREVLQHAKVVTLPRVPFPPVDRFGLPELADIQRMSFAGITFKDTFFIQQGHTSESLYFHEMVHIVQWARLGVDNFLWAYGLGLHRFGYERSPLEQMAYTLQASFDTDSLPDGLVGVIETGTDAIWSQVAPVVASVVGHDAGRAAESW